MDFGQLPKSAMELVAALTIAVNTSFTPAIPPPSETNLTQPSFISSYNLPSEIIAPNQNPQLQQSLEPKTEEGINLILVTKEPEPVKLVTVEQPIMYTVVEPAKSVKKDEEPEIKTEIIKEAKAKEPSPSPVPTPTPSPSSTPTPLVQGNSNSDQLFQMVNDHRAKLA